MSRPMVLVIGATGAQGGSVARHLLHRQRFRVRAMTRDPASRRARAMQQAGVEPVYGDLDDVGSLRKALIDCHAVFGVTDYWEHYEMEYTQGRNLIEAVITSRVRHIVLSTQPHASRISHRTLAVPQYDLKAQLEAYVRDTSLPATFVHVAFYYDNFLTTFLPERRPDGGYRFRMPQGDVPLAAVAAADIGGVVASLFEDPATHIGQTIGVVGDDRPPADYARIMSEVLERPIHYEHLDYVDFTALPVTGARELAAELEFNRRYVPERSADLALSRQLYPAIRTFETWLRSQAERFHARLRQT